MTSRDKIGKILNIVLKPVAKQSKKYSLFTICITFILITNFTALNTIIACR